MQGRPFENGDLFVVLERDGTFETRIPGFTAAPGLCQAGAPSSLFSVSQSEPLAVNWYLNLVRRTSRPVGMCTRLFVGALCFCGFGSISFRMRASVTITRVFSWLQPSKFAISPTVNRSYLQNNFNNSFRFWSVVLA